MPSASERTKLSNRVRHAITIHSLSDRGSSYLDLLRGLSALAVMIGHLRGLFFVPFGEVQDPIFPIRALYFLTSLGHEAVVVFFVLSGYFIGSSVLRSATEGSWDWHAYITRRLTRLYIVLIPALIIGGLIDLAGLKLFGTAGPYSGHPVYAHIVPYLVADRLTVPIFFGNVVFLEEIFFATFGSNGPLWSLSYEFWFYLMFPCAALALMGTSGLLRRALYGGLFVALAFFVGRTIFSYFFIWLLGVAVVLAPPIKARSLFLSVARFGVLVLCFAALLFHKRIDMTGFAADAVLALPILLLVYTLANGPEGTAKGLWDRLRLGRFSHGIAGFSYTLYLVHLPLLILLHAAVIWSGGVRWQPDVTHVAIAIGIALLIVGYAWVLSRLTEARTQPVTTYLLMLVKRNTLKAKNLP